MTDRRIVELSPGAFMLPLTDDRVDRVRELAGAMKVKFFFANQYATCTGCRKEIWPDDTVSIDQAGTGLRHEDCADEQ